LAEEWDEKNLIKPSQVISGSNKKFWWRCKRDNSHQWEAAVSSRVKGSGCPICANQKLLVGFNDMATLHPELKAIWHPKKNGDLQPFELIGGSSKKVWWQCDRNPQHAWQSPPNRLVTQGRGCPVCSNKILVSGQNDLGTLSPELAKEFDRELNQSDPETVNVGSHRKYWWRCNVRPTHLWQASPGQRKLGHGCPYCAGRRVETGFNDLESRFPDLAKEWDLDLNNGLLPSQVTKSSQMKASWKCARDSEHQWVATVASRASGNGCPVCSGQKTVAGINDLETKFDWIASQWHPVKNGNIKPSAISPGSTMKAWWICLEYPTHEWLASVASRTRMNSGCPICANLQVEVGFNDLETLRPDVAKTWHKTQNGALTPSQVVLGTNRLVWWQCPSVESHAWRTSVRNRVKGKGCPQCLPAGYQTSKPGYFYAIKNIQLGAKKIGITNSPSTEGRLKNFSTLGWEIVKVWYFDDGFIPLAAETRLLRWIRQDLNLPPYLSPAEMKRAGGWSETFSNDGLDDETLLSECSRVLIEESYRLVGISRAGAIGMPIKRKIEFS
jgi:DNA-directed RNA polymerase subunit RPC12/RpoP